MHLSEYFSNTFSFLRKRVCRGLLYFDIYKDKVSLRMQFNMQVTPRKDGFHSFTVYDLCLEVTSHPQASVSVSGVGSVQVNVIEKVSAFIIISQSDPFSSCKTRSLISFISLRFFSLCERTFELLTKQVSQWVEQATPGQEVVVSVPGGASSLLVGSVSV